MSICKSGFAAIRKFYDHVTPELETIAGDVIAITGKIKALESNPTVEAIVAIIPEGSTYEAAFNKAIDLIDTGVVATLSVSEKISDWLHEQSPLLVNAVLVKLASVTTSIADTVNDPVKTEAFYDTLIQNTIVSAK